MLQYNNESQFFIIFQLAGSVLPQVWPLGLLTLGIGLVLAILRKQNKIADVLTEEDYVTTDIYFKILCTVVGFLLVMRTNQALNRWMHAVTQVEIMLSKWSDAYNALNSFFSGKQGSPEVLERILLFRIRVAHWFSLMSCLAFATLKNGHVNNLSQVGIHPKYPEGVLKTSFSHERNLGQLLEEEEHDQTLAALQVLHAPTEEEVEVLEGASDKVNIIALWIVQGIMLEVREKTLDAPPPIVTRVFQEISIGMLGFHQAHKVAMVPFPFPFAQMVTMLLTLLYIAFPFFIDNFTQHVIITPVISFIIPVCYCSLNSLAVDLEVPFGESVNCVDIEHFNQAFLDLLEDTLLQPQVPPSSDFARMEREVIQGVDFSKPREDPVPMEGAALVPAASFARTPDPLASAAVMPVANWNLPRASSPPRSSNRAKNSDDGLRNVASDYSIEDHDGPDLPIVGQGSMLVAKDATDEEFQPPPDPPEPPPAMPPPAPPPDRTVQPIQADARSSRTGENRIAIKADERSSRTGENRIVSKPDANGPTSSSGEARVSTKEEVKAKPAEGTLPEKPSSQANAKPASRTEGTLPEKPSPRAGTLPEKPSPQADAKPVSRTEGALPEKPSAQANTKPVSRTEGALPEKPSAQASTKPVSRTEGALPEKPSAQANATPVSRTEGALPEKPSAQTNTKPVSRTEGTLPEKSSRQANATPVSRTEGTVPQKRLERQQSANMQAVQSSSSRSIPQSSSNRGLAPSDDDVVDFSRHAGRAKRR